MSNHLTDAVKQKYQAVAESDLSSKHPGVRAVAEAFGYSAAELASIPSEANMGLSCGNPTATANLRPGEVVLDLGCGGGLDVFLAAEKVGSAGKAIGIDMTPAMIARAKKNAENGPGGRPFANVEFHLARMDRMPLVDASVDVVISNCVINLAEDKSAVFREIVRILKPGGRLAVSDIALKKSLPREIADDVMAFVACIAGAMLIDDYRSQLIEAGFAHVEVVDGGADLNAYANVQNQSGCVSPPMLEPPKRKTNALEILPTDHCCSASATAGVHGGLADLLRRYDINEYAASVKVLAVKPQTADISQKIEYQSVA